MFSNFRIMASYNLIGADKEYFLPLTKHVVAHAETYDYKTLESFLKIIQRFEKEDEFEEMIRALIYQIEKYDLDGNLKPKYE